MKKTNISPFWKRRIPFLIIVLGLVLVGMLILWQVRGRNSTPITARGGEPFRQFARLEAPFYLQRDPRWAEETIGASGERLSKVGCTVCSLAMALEHYGVHRTPAELNAWLKANGGYNWRGWLRWHAISKAADGSVAVDIVAKPTHADIDGALRQSRPVMVKVLISRLVPHWVLIVGKEGQEYVIHDPLGDGRTVEPLSKYESDIYGVRIIKPGP
jgi:hypothetical protein